jgi:Uma2 family endonuclease
MPWRARIRSELARVRFAAQRWVVQRKMSWLATLPAGFRPANAVGSPFHFGDDGPGGWVILAEPELHLGAEILVPDLAGWRLARMPARSTEAFIDIAPDWICEILSPSTARFDRVEKMPIYAHHAVPYLWLIDPIARTLEAYSLDNDRWVLLGAHGGDQIVKVVPFDAVGIELGRLWG